MKINKGDRLRVSCARKGTYIAKATGDFDTEADEWYSVAVAQKETVQGMANEWRDGDPIPCRRGHVTIEKL